MRWYAQKQAHYPGTLFLAAILCAVLSHDVHHITPHPTFISFSSIFHVFPIKQNHTQFPRWNIRNSINQMTTCKCAAARIIHTMFQFRMCGSRKPSAHKCPADIWTLKSWYLMKRFCDWTFKANDLVWLVNTLRKLVNSNSIFVEFSDEWNLKLGLGPILRGRHSCCCCAKTSIIHIFRMCKTFWKSVHFHICVGFQACLLFFCANF